MANGVVGVIRVCGGGAVCGELTEAAGLVASDEIIVDETRRTAADRIDATGDCARLPSTHTRARQCLKSIQNVTGQADHVGRDIVDGARGAYPALPWFWRGQKTLRPRTAGLAHAHEVTVTLGDPDAGRFDVAVFRAERLAAVESVDRPADYRTAPGC
ncbi:oxidoreductase C-terminal domain-containing protein [Streptomyces sp. NPDC006872]|uniref:oxidoreductase C-terminal domain-containing protein n=1 Tax=Streptomyces sp. NPDC006872 TaxID=3155720 RepID=UPI0033EF459C